MIMIIMICQIFSDLPIEIIIKSCVKHTLLYVQIIHARIAKEIINPLTDNKHATIKLIP